MTDKATELLAKLAYDLTLALGCSPNIYDEYESEEMRWEGILLNDLEEVNQYLDSIGYNKNDPQRDAEKSAPHQCDVPNPRE